MIYIIKKTGGGGVARTLDASVTPYQELHAGNTIICQGLRTERAQIHLHKIIHFLNPLSFHDALKHHLKSL